MLFKSEKCSKFTQFRSPSAEMNEFGECLESIGVFYHSFVGPCFTWSNNQVSTY